MKLTDGLFHRVFNEIGEEYPDIIKDHYILDIGAAFVAEKPEIFDVIVTLNLYGDVISDIAAEVAGSVGIAGSANIGDGYAMFEAIHGSAPTISGQNIANPSGLLQGAIQMLVHIGQSEVAEKINNAWLKTIEDGIHTRDIYSYNHSTELVGTNEFANAVIERLGQLPTVFKPVEFSKDARITTEYTYKRKDKKKEMTGVDIFIDSIEPLDDIVGKLQGIPSAGMELKMIANRGVNVWPGGQPETFLSDHYRLRYQATNKTVTHNDIILLLESVAKTGLDFIKTETLCTFDGKPGYSLAQGE